MNSSPWPSRIRVVGKVRGYTKKEFESLGKNSTPWITVEKNRGEGSSQRCTVSFHTQSTRRKDVYELDDCYEQDEEVDLIYSREIQPLVLKAFDGLNSSVIALGARGSGKTVTMQGSHEKPGLAVLAISEILTKARESSKSVSVSLYEVAQEHVYDLLNPDHPHVQVLEDGQGNIKLKGLSQVSVKDFSEFSNIFFSDDRLQNDKKVCVDHSHNHKGLMVHISSENVSVGTKRESKINFVDLAGYEDSRNSSRDGFARAESNRNNRSLYALLNVVTAICADAIRVPYRESKLTRILQDSLSCTSHILLLTCLNPVLCQASVSSMSLVSRSFQSNNQVLTDSTNRSQSSAKLKMISSSKNTKAMSSLIVKKYMCQSVKKPSNVLKGRRLFSEEKVVKPKQVAFIDQPSYWRSSSRKIKILPNPSSAVVPFTLEEAPDEKIIYECTSIGVTAKDINFNEPGSQSMAELQDPWSPKPELQHTLSINEHNDELDVMNSSPTTVTDHLEGTNPIISLVIEDQMHETADTVDGSKEVELSHKGDDGSPLISERIRAISNNLKSLCATTQPLLEKITEDAATCSTLVEPQTPRLEPQTPRLELTATKLCSPRGTFSNRTSGMKHSLVREYLNFLNSANKEELKSVKGIGEKRATYILELREKHPEPFESLDDIQEIGLSSKQIRVMMKHVAEDLFN